MRKGLKHPNKEGWWYLVPSNQIIEIYELEPVSVLCLCGPDVGITYSGAADTQAVWTTDEWQGHIPATRYDEGPWVFLSKERQEIFG